MTLYKQEQLFITVRNLWWKDCKQRASRLARQFSANPRLQLQLGHLLDVVVLRVFIEIR